MKRLLLAGVLLAMGTAAAAQETPIPLLTGPQNVGSLTATLNTLIRQINAVIAGGQGSFSPATYDPLCNGQSPAHDCTVAVQAAINAAAAAIIPNDLGNAIPAVFFDSGVYTVCNLTAVPRQSFIGQSQTSSILRLKDGCNGNMFTVSALAAGPAFSPTYYQLSWVSFINLFLDGNKANQSGTSYGIELADAPNDGEYHAGLNVDYVEIIEFLSGGIRGGLRRNVSAITNSQVRRHDGPAVFSQGYDWSATDSAFGGSTFGWEQADRGATSWVGVDCFAATDSGCLKIDAGSGTAFKIVGGSFDHNDKEAIQHDGSALLTVVGTTFNENGGSADNTFADVKITGGAKVSLADIQHPADAVTVMKYFIEQTGTTNPITVLSPQIAPAQTWGTALYSHPELINALLAGKPFRLGGSVGETSVATDGSRWSDNRSQWTADAIGMRTACTKSRAVVPETHATVNSSDELCSRYVYADDGTNYVISGNELWQVTTSAVSAGVVPTLHRIQVQDNSGVMKNAFEENGSLNKVITYLHPAYAGDAPAITTCGASPSVDGNDALGKVTIGGGGAVTACTVTFAATWIGGAPVCTLTGIATGAVVLSVTSVTDSVLVIAASADVQSKVINYRCAGVHS